MTKQIKKEVRIIESWLGGYTVEIGQKTHPGIEAPWVPETYKDYLNLEKALTAAQATAETYGIDYIGCYDRFEQPVKRSKSNDKTM